MAHKNLGLCEFMEDLCEIIYRTLENIVRKFLIHYLLPLTLMFVFHL